MRYFVKILFLLLFPAAAFGQSFVNGDLEGPPNTNQSVVAQGWQNVPATDPVCNASSLGITDTPDLTSLIRPSPSMGIIGNPYSGQTFMSGFVSQVNGENRQHEGIMQTVTGLVPDSLYEIGFMQAVVKQSNCLDPSGSWAVFADTTLIAVVPPTFSNAPFNSTSFIWEPRRITFVATAAQHTFKFLPADDDSNLELGNDPNGSLRMGIDSVYLKRRFCPLTVNLGNDLTLCEGQTTVLSAVTPGATYNWQNGSNSATLLVTQPGTYWVQVSGSGCTVSDTVTVQFLPRPNVWLGNDTALCTGAVLLLQPGLANTSFVWNDASTAATLEVTQPGTYWVTATANGCSRTDSIQVAYNAFPEVWLGNDTTLCQGDVLTLTATTAGATYLWQDQSNAGTFAATQPGQYWVELTRNNCTSRSHIELDFADCSTELVMPNIITPNNDGYNDHFVPILGKNIRAMRTVLFDRWGRRIFESDSPEKNWDGSAENGEPATDGTYFYHITYEGIRSGTAVVKGWVTVVR